MATLAVTALALGTALGLAATAWTIRHRFDPAATVQGAWMSWPKVGTPAIDPYARAIMAESGEVPMVAAEGQLLIAERDQAGSGLTGRCDYRLSGRTLPARWWSVSVVRSDGRASPNPIGRSGFASTSLLRAGDGTFDIWLSPAARPGNWLPTPAAPFRLALHLYEAVPASRGGASEYPLPTIERGVCRP